MIVVVVAAYVAQKYQNDAARERDRATNIALCEGSVERSSYVANGFRILSQRVGKRAHPGDKVSAQNYIAVADSIVSTFPGVAQKDSRVDRIEKFDGTIEFRIPAQVKKLQADGCRQSFK